MDRTLLRTLGDNTRDLIYAKDLEGHFLYVNAKLLQMSGVDSADKMIGKTDFDFSPKDLAQGYFEDDQAVILSNKPLTDREELVLDSDTGQARWHSTTKVPLTDNGKVIGIMGITRDITARRQAEEEAKKLNIELEKRVEERTQELKKLSDVLAHERNLMRTLVDSLPDNVFVKDTQSRFLLANQAIARAMGTTIEQLLGKTDFEFFPDKMAQSFFDSEQKVVQTGKPVHLEEPYLNQEKNQLSWVMTSKVPVRNSAGKVIGIVGIGRDITERRASELALQESQERFRNLTELSSDWYWEQDKNFAFIKLADPNHKSGYRLNDVRGKTLQQLSHAKALSSDWNSHQKCISSNLPFRNFEFQVVDAEGNNRYLSLSGLPNFGDNGEFDGYRGIGCDITERKTAEAHTQYLATHDSLTNLPNRAMFFETLDLAIDSALRNRRKLAVLFIDLDRFKNINDTLGHNAGDTLLVEMSSRLSTSLRSCDVVARLGGDEFAILIQDITDPEQVAKVARKVINATASPATILGQECRVTASIGVSIYPGDARDTQSIMKNADIAMYRAKDEGKNTYQFYSADISTRAFDRLTLENNLRLGIERDELFLEYQAKRDLKTGDICGVEALIRWQHPKYGVIPPDNFIPLAEETGLIVLVGRWVLKTACTQARRWQKDGFAPIGMAVNLSVRQLYDGHLVDDIAQALKESGLQPELLEMEITEGMVMQDTERAIRILQAIKGLGVRLAIDDFGVGYSSLAKIKRFPIDTLKVDRSFICDLPQNTEDRAIAEAIIAMGRTLNLTVIAEGVETVEQETFLRLNHCDQSQGFYFSPPKSPEKFSELMREQINRPRQF
ncbi:EAL domain-containing protein [Gilvimarinus agarilyticus]|uniref:EAL domain-containing protein n=1 Tax=Gilvimarinus sp. 2_MG-2023 TaxID=3062666 RepID=UPI001C08A828|nr:EAL domain-containing protein [Gilvimarinus sp. 2_MG-2023]MBU2886209.1 EAL domain-containing protein [Gilvimarinus agarilyticus]MDO6570897.1 EAL domain-containing protein [Gilvimarinus sp. 2_MG-2023]